MADLQISQLPALAEADLAAGDELAVVDGSASETKRITAKALVERGVALIDSGSIPGSALASLGANTVVTASITDANVTNAKLANSSFSFGGLTISLGSTDATPAIDLTDATNYPASSLTGTITNAQLAGSIANNKLANSSISLGGVSINLGDTNATPTFDLTNATNYPASSLTGTVSNAQLAGSIANSKLVNSSINIGGVTFNLGDSDTSPALDLSDATNYPTSSLSGTITNAQLAGSIQGSKILGASISSTELGANSVTAVQLADNSVDTGAVIDSSITDAKISAVSGTKITAGSLPATALNTSNLGTGLAISSNNLVINNTVVAGTAAKVSFSAQGLITGSASLAASDLPLADATNVGGVSIPSGSGLSVTNAGALSLSNSISATTVSGVSVNSHGLITGITALVSSDIPTATTSNKGGVIVQSGGGLSVDASGNITTTTSGVSAGTYQSVVVTNKGIITSGSSLTDAEIPNISAAKLTSGTIDAARFAANSIGREKFSDTSTTIFGSVSQSGYPNASYAGEFFFDSVEEDLYIWDSNAWQPVTTLTKGSLKLGGVYNASNSSVSSVTSHGSSVGLTVGQNLPTPSSTTDATYLIVGTGGTPSGIPNGPTGELIPPDYLLSVTSSTGSSWVEIDLSTTVSSPTASNVSVISGWGGSSTNVQNALAELSSGKLSLGGGNITGEIKIENSGSFAFEGTANDYETRLTIVDPTSADRTITFPDASGTVILSGQTGVVDSTMISDGAIMNADINGSAGIAISKLEALTGAQIIIGNSSNEPVAVAVTGDISIDNTGLTAIGAAKIVNSMVSGSAAIAGSKITAASTSAVGTVQLNDSTNSTSTSEAATANALKTAYDLANTANTAAAAAFQTTGGTITGDVTIDNAKELRFSEADGDGANYTAFKAQAQSSDITYTWPNTSPSGGQVLKANASTPTTLEWAADSATDNTKMPLSGGTFTDDVIFTGDSSNGLWDKSASAFVANLTGNVTGNVSGTSGGFTAGSASNLDSGTVNVARLGSGSSVTTKFLRGDNTWQTISATPEGTAILSTGESGTSKFLRVDGDGTCSWQTVSSDLVNDTTPQLGGNLDVNTKNIIFGDSSDGSTDDVLKFGAGTDLSIYSEGNTGVLNGDVQFLGQGQNIEWDKSASLLWFKTNSNGGQSAKAHWGDGISYGNLEIYMAQGGPAIIQTQNQNLQIASGNSTDVNVLTSKDINFINSTNSTNYYMRCKENSGSDQCVELYYGNTPTKRLETTNTGATIIGSLKIDGPSDGDATVEIRGREARDAKLSLISDDGDDNPDFYYIKAQNSDNSLRIQNHGDNTDEDNIVCHHGGAVELFWDNAVRLATSSAGATLTGALVADGLTVDTNTLHVDATNNKVGIGLTSPETQLEVLGSVWTKRSTADQWAEQFRGRKNRAGSIVQDNDDILTILGQGYDGSAYRDAAKIEIEIDGTPGSQDMPGRLLFSTTADGANSSTERLRISSAGAIGIAGANYGSDGQVLTSKGGSAAPEWADAGGGGNSVDLVADGAIAAGKPVIIKSNGKAEEVKTTVAALSALVRNTGSEQTTDSFFNTDNYYFDGKLDTNAAYDPDSDTCLCIIRSHSSSSDNYTVKAMLWSSSGDDLNHEQTTNVSGVGESSSGRQAVIALSSRRYMIIFYNSSTGYAQVRIATVNTAGDGFTLGSAYNLFSSQEGPTHIKGIESTTNRVIVICKSQGSGQWTDGGGTPGIVVGDITSGNVWNHRSSTQLDSNTASYYDVAYDSTNALFIGQFRSNSDDYMRAVAFTVSNNNSATLTKGSVSTLGSNASTRNNIMYHANSGSFVSQWRNSSGNARNQYRAMTVNSSTLAITLGTQVEVVAAGGERSMAMAITSDHKIVSAWATSSSDGNDVLTSVISITGTSLTTGTATQIMNPSWNIDRMGIAFMDHNNMIACFGIKGSAGLVRGTADTRGGTPNITAHNCIGFASAAISDGATGTINTDGSTVDNQSSLTAGSRYWVADDGTLAGSANTTQAGGVALSSTKLLIKMSA